MIKLNVGLNVHYKISKNLQLICQVHRMEISRRDLNKYLGANIINALWIALSSYFLFCCAIHTSTCMHRSVFISIFLDVFSKGEGRVVEKKINALRKIKGLHCALDKFKFSQQSPATLDPLLFSKCVDTCYYY